MASLVRDLGGKVLCYFFNREKRILKKYQFEGKSIGCEFGEGFAN